MLLEMATITFLPKLYFPQGTMYGGFYNTSVNSRGVMWVTFMFKKWKFREGGELTAVSSSSSSYFIYPRIFRVHYILFVVEVFSGTTQRFFFCFLFLPTLE